MADPITPPADGQEPKDEDNQDPSNTPDPQAGNEDPPASPPATPIDWENEARLARAEAASRRVELQQLREQTKDAKSLDEVNTLISDFEGKVQAAELAAARERAGRKYGLPDAVVGRLQGDDEDAIIADAEALSALFSASTPRPPAPPEPTGGRNPKAPKDEESPEEAWARAKRQL